jgi:predicted transcriptional regulator
MKQTSVIASRMAEKGLKKEHFARILKAMRDKKPRNYEAIAKRAGLEPVSVARRLSEMVKDGCMIETGTVSLTSKRRPATNYIINDKVLKAA